MKRQSELQAQADLAALRDLKIRLNTATRFLCELTSKLTPELIEKVDGLADWVKVHAEMDAKRRAKEKAKREAKEKANLLKKKKEEETEKRVYEQLKKKYG